MANPSITALPEAPQRRMARDTYPVVADKWAAALGPFTSEVNTVVTWMGQQVTATAASATAAADSATAAAQSASAAATQAGNAKTSADAAAASLASSETVAAAVRASVGLPSLDGKEGYYWRVKPDGSKTLELVPLVTSQVGDVITSTQAPDSAWIQTGIVYMRSQYPKLSAKIGAIADWRADQSNISAVSGFSATYWSQPPVFGANKLIAHGKNQANSQMVFAYSQDAGNTWSWNAAPLNGDSYVYFLWTGSQFFGVHSNDLRVVTSNDGMSWTLSQASVMPNNNGNNYNYICYGNGVYIAGTNGVASYSRCSGNPASASAWSIVSAPESFNISDIKFILGLFVISRSGNNTYYTSPDGVTWTKRTYPLTYANVLVSNDSSAVMTSGGTLVYVTTDLITWQFAASLTGLANISGGGGCYIATVNQQGGVQQNGLYHVSNDGVKWSSKQFSFYIPNNGSFTFALNFMVALRYNDNSVFRVKAYSYPTSSQFYAPEVGATPFGLNQYIKAS